MARTILDEVLQVRPDFIEHQLARAVKAEKMMQVWTDYLDGLKQVAKVIPLKRIA